MLSNTIDRRIRASPNPSHVLKVLDKKRRDVLNKVYMTQITEALCFGGFEELDGRGLQITHVSAKNNNIVEVFWVANESEDLIQMQSILSSLSGKIAYQLTFSGVVGHTPEIVFIRDTISLRTEEIQRLLEKLEHEMRLEDDRREVDEDETKVRDEPKLIMEAGLPKMRMDTLGLPYDRILNRIRDSKVKSYPLQVPVPPTQEEFQNSLATSKKLSNSVIKKHQSKRELQKFISLYQKSELCSSARRTREREVNLFCAEGYDDEDDLHNEDEAEFDCDLDTEIKPKLKLQVKI